MNSNLKKVDEDYDRHMIDFAHKLSQYKSDTSVLVALRPAPEFCTKDDYDAWTRELKEMKSAMDEHSRNHILYCKKYEDSKIDREAQVKSKAAAAIVSSSAKRLKLGLCTTPGSGESSIFSAKGFN